MSGESHQDARVARHEAHLLPQIQKWKTGFSQQQEKNRVSYKDTPMRLSGDFSTETLQGRRDWKDTFKDLKGKNLQPRLLLWQDYLE